MRISLHGVPGMRISLHGVPGMRISRHGMSGMRISGRCLGGRGRVGVMAVLGQGQRAGAEQGDQQRRVLQGSVL